MNDQSLNDSIFSFCLDVLKYNIRALRKANGLTIEETAEQCELPLSTYKELESAEVEKMPSLKTVLLVVNTFGVKIDDLLYRFF